MPCCRGARKSASISSVRWPSCENTTARLAAMKLRPSRVSAETDQSGWAASRQAVLWFFPSAGSVPSNWPITADQVSPGVGGGEPHDVVVVGGERAPGRRLPVHHPEHLVDPVGGQGGIDRRAILGGQLGIQSVDQRLVCLPSVAEAGGLLARPAPHRGVGRGRSERLLQGLGPLGEQSRQLGRPLGPDRHQLFGVLARGQSPRPRSGPRRPAPRPGGRTGRRRSSPDTSAPRSRTASGAAPGRSGRCRRPGARGRSGSRVVSA